MLRLSLIHLSGPRRGEVDLVQQLPATIGSELGSSVLVPGITPLHARIVGKGSDILIQDTGSEEGTFLAGEPVREALLRDGDVLQLGSAGPKLRFRNEGEEKVPLLQALEWARPVGAPKGFSDTTAFFRALLREAEARTSRVFRLVVSLLLIVALVLLSWSYRMSGRLQRQLASVEESLKKSEDERKAFQNRIEEERRRAAADRRAAKAKEAEFRQREAELQKQLAEAANGEVQTLRSGLTLARSRLEALEKESAVGERIIRDYGAGVCLIQASYGFYDESGRALKISLDDTGKPEQNSEGTLELSVDAKGPVHSVDILGTGFLVDRRGLVVTNRHVGEPWWKDETAIALAEKGFHARLIVFRAFFPRLEGPVELKVERHSEIADLSLLRADLVGKKVPSLPLDQTGKGAVPGKAVVVVGYPTGLEAILAKADTALVHSLLEASGTRSDQLAEALSRKGLIRPSTTQGHIGDVTRTDIVFDAPTTQGGSGGPIFNQDGVVIAVEYAVLPKFGGNAFGIPVRNVLGLLKGPATKAPSD
jgi:S1-C subfamily serine protease